MNNSDAKILRDALRQRRPGTRVTLQDLKTLIDCRISGNYSAVTHTRLYKRQGGAYSECLELLLEADTRQKENNV